MPDLQFNFRAVDPRNGLLKEGRTVANDAYAVRMQLRHQGLEPLEVARADVGLRGIVGTWVDEEWQRICRHLRKKVKADFYDALATLLTVGTPLDVALETLGRSQVRGKREKILIATLRQGVQEGESLDAICRKLPAWFGIYDLAVLEGGMTSGDLMGALTTLAQHHSRAVDTDTRLAASLAYLLLLGALGFAAFQFLGTNTLPAFVSAISHSGAPIPFLTHVVLELSAFFSAWWPALIILIACTAIGIRVLLRGERSMIFIERFRVIIPGSAIRDQLALARVALALTGLLRAGISLAPALHIAAGLANSRRMSKALHACCTAMMAGEDLSRTLSRFPWVDPEFIKVIQLGEGGGDLPALLERSGERHERIARRNIERQVALAGPVAMIVVATLIGLLVLSVVLPLSQMTESI